MPIDEYTKLLLHCNGIEGSTTFIDDSPSAHVVTSHNGADINTSIKKFGTGGGDFTSANSYLSIPDHVDWDFGTGDFTIEGWYKPQNTIFRVMIDIGGATQGIIVSVIASVLSEDADVTIVPYLKGDTKQYLVNHINTTQHFHWAVVRYNNQLSVYIQGKKSVQTWDVTSYNFNNITLGVRVGVGITGFNDRYCLSYQDEIRISNIARYTEEFTPPTNEFGEFYDYEYEGDIEANLIPESDYKQCFNWQVLGEIPITFNPEGIGKLTGDYTYVGEIITYFILESLYHTGFLTVGQYEGDITFNMIPQSTDSFITTFSYDGEIVIQINTESSAYQDFIYVGEVSFLLNLLSDYLSAKGYAYSGEVTIHLSPEVSDVEYYFAYDGSLVITLNPESLVDTQLVISPILHKKPNKFFADLQNLLKLKGKLILVYPAIQRDKCDLEQNKFKRFLNPIPIRALVEDYSPDGQLRNPYGVTGVGTKELIMEYKYKNLMKVGAKLKIDNELYVVFKDNVSGRHQIWNRSDMTRVIVTKL